ncbi:MAG: hypothetical protein AAF515_21535 [Pseudomonadota bacterium]
MSDYQVLFSGQLVDGFDRERVQASLADALGVPENKARYLFSGKTVVLQSKLSEAEANRLQERLHDLGALARVKNLAPKAAQPADFESDRADKTLRDLTAAHVECPRCSHVQLEAVYCARCGVEIEVYMRQQRKARLLAEKRERDAAQKEQLSPHGAIVAETADALAGDPRRKPAKKQGMLKRLFSRS